MHRAASAGSKCGCCRRPMPCQRRPDAARGYAIFAERSDVRPGAGMLRPQANGRQAQPRPGRGQRGACDSPSCVLVTWDEGCSNTGYKTLRFLLWDPIRRPLSC